MIYNRCSGRRIFPFGIPEKVLWYKVKVICYFSVIRYRYRFMVDEHSEYDTGGENLWRMSQDVPMRRRYWLQAAGKGCCREEIFLKAAAFFCGNILGKSGSLQLCRLRMKKYLIK